MNIDLGWAAASPLIWIAATLLAYGMACQLYARSGCHPLAHPVAISVAILMALLILTGTPYSSYFDSAQLIHFLLGPATVALAIPLYQQIRHIKDNWFALTMAATLGSAASVATGMGVAWMLGASHATIFSMAAKSVTMPIAMGITEKIGGLPSLTSAFVMLTGILGATVAPGILHRMRISDESTCGFALGVAAHGIGAARAFQISQRMGAFAALAMGLSGILTALILPFVLTWLS